MSRKFVCTAYCIADKIDLPGYKQSHPDNLITKSSRELCYQLDTLSYIYLLSYGVVVFSGLKKEEIDKHLERILPYAMNPKSTFTSDELPVEIGDLDDRLDLGFETLSLGRFDHGVNKLIMMHLGQSVALDHFNALSQQILSEVKAYANHMQLYGKVKLGHKKALKFIGKTLTTKNSIAEHIYILDSPEAAWEDEYADRLHTTLARHFELVPRYREIDNTLKIIEENLDVYISYNNHRESSRLEWIIIILIVIEVIDTLASKWP